MNYCSLDGSGCPPLFDVRLLSLSMTSFHICVSMSLTLKRSGLPEAKGQGAAASGASIQRASKGRQKV